MLHTSDEGNYHLWKEGARFLFTFLVGAVLLYVLLQPFEHALQELVTAHARAVLSVLGTPTQTLNTIQFWAGNKLMEISPLCSSFVEMILLASVILATRTKTNQQKLRGVVGGIILVYVLNVLRIVMTVQQVTHTDISFATFTHDWLFRGLLFIGLAGVYYLWLNSQTLQQWARSRGIF